LQYEIELQNLSRNAKDFDFQKWTLKGDQNPSSVIRTSLVTLLAVNSIFRNSAPLALPLSTNSTLLIQVILGSLFEVPLEAHFSRARTEQCNYLFIVLKGASSRIDFFDKKIKFHFIIVLWYSFTP
jgi:hypothetical protein